MDRTAMARLLPKFSPFMGMNDDQLEEVAAKSHYQLNPRGQTIFNRGESAQGMYLLQEGQVKLAISSPQGSEKVIGIVEQEECFGEATIFMEKPRFPVSAHATKDCKVVFIPRRVIMSMLEKDNQLARKMLTGLSMRNDQLVKDIESVSLYTCSQRLISYLLQIVEVSADKNCIKLPASKSNIASLLNITPETLSRTLFKLEQAELIAVRGNTISILDLDGLSQFECAK